MFHLSWAYSSLITLRLCKHECFPCGTDPPPPLSVQLSLLIPLAGSWGRLCGAQPWYRLFTTRLNRPVWTAGSGGLPLPVATSLPLTTSAICPSLAEPLSLKHGRHAGHVVREVGGDEERGFGGLACKCVYRDHPWQPSGLCVSQILVTFYFNMEWKEQKEKNKINLANSLHCKLVKHKVF